MKKYVFLALFVGLRIPSLGQMERTNINVSFSTEPIAILDKDIVGWVLVKDGRWESEPNTIKYPYVSKNKDKDKRLSIGQDNIESIEVFDVLIGEKRYWLYVKYYESGKYKYETRQKGWKKRKDAYYYLVDPYLLPNLLELQDDNSYVFFVKTISHGKLSNIKKKDVLISVHNSIEFPLKSERFMTWHIRLNKQDNKAQFLICSLHSIFKGTDGILYDYKIRDKSIYGNKTMFDHLYYESTYLNLLNILPLFGAKEE